MKKPTIQTQTLAAGFSLLELLVVIAIIALLAGVGSIALRPPRPVEAAQLVSGVIEATRVEAIRNGGRTRVAINLDPTDDDYLQQVITLEDIDRDPTTNDWTITSKRVFPQGTIYLEGLSGNLSGNTQEMNIDPDNLSSQDGNAGGLFHYQEFDGVGKCKSSTQWIFGRGVIADGTLTLSSEKDLDGFIIRKTGKTNFFSSPSQITSPVISP